MSGEDLMENHLAMQRQSQFYYYLVYMLSGVAFKMILAVLMSYKVPVMNYGWVLLFDA